MLSLMDFIGLGKTGWGVGAAAWRWLRRNKRKLSPQERLALRHRWKTEVEAKLAAQRKEEIKSIEVIIRDMRRMDHYPEVKEGKGISSWFRGDLLYTYERGIMVGLSWESLKVVDEEHLRFCNFEEKGDVTLMRTGFIPYEGIEHIDWLGDHYYSDPHIYCYFDQKHGQPYERIAFCDQRETSYTEYWVEVVDYDAVRKMSRKMKVERYPPKRR
jgi:hypothetical protein